MEGIFVLHNRGKNSAVAEKIEKSRKTRGDVLKKTPSFVVRNVETGLGEDFQARVAGSRS